MPYFLKQGKFVSWVTDAASWKSRGLMDLRSAAAFGGAMSATTYVPFFTAGTRLSTEVEGYSGGFLDGHLASNLGDETIMVCGKPGCRTVFFEILPFSMPRVPHGRRESCRSYACHKKGNYSPFREVFLWGNPAWADSLFSRGVQDAEAQQDNIKELLDWLDGIRG